MNNYVKCFTCGAKAGSPCITKYNTEARFFHKSRQTVAEARGVLATYRQAL